MKQFIINEFEKVASEDFNNIQASIHQSIYEKTLYPFFKKQDGFVGDGFKPERLNDANLKLTAGRGFMLDVTQTGHESKYRALQLESDLTLTLGSFDWPAAPVANSRIDLVVVRSARTVTQQSDRFVRTGGTGPVVTETVDKVVEDLCEFDVIVGTASGSPVAPALPPGWLKVAQVLIGTSGMLNSGSVTDTRVILMPASGAFATESRFVSPSGLGTDTSLQAAIANLPPNGGSIFLLENISIDATHAIPAKSVLRSLGRAVEITVLAGGKITVASDSSIEDVTIVTALTAAASFVELIGNRARIRGVKFVPPAAATNTCLVVSGNACDVRSCDFIDCDDFGTNRAIQFTGQALPAVGRGSVQDHFSRTIVVSSASSPFTIRPEMAGATILLDTTSGPVNLIPPTPQRGFKCQVRDRTGRLSTNKSSLISSGFCINGLPVSFDLEADFGTWELLCDGTDYLLL